MAVRAIRRRKPQIKSLKGRVIRLKDGQSFEKLLKKAGERLVLVHYSTARNASSKRMRTILHDLSKRQEFQHVFFAEVDTEEDGVRDFVKEQGVSNLPAVHAWKGGSRIEAVVGSEPFRILQLLQKHAGESPKGLPSGWKRWLKVLGAGVAITAAVGGAVHLLQAKRNPSEEGLQRRLVKLGSLVEVAREDLARCTAKTPSSDIHAMQKDMDRLKQQKQAVEAQLAGVRTSAPSTSPSDVKQPHKQPSSASSLGQSMDAEEEEVEDEEEEKEEEEEEEEEDVGEEEDDEEDVEEEE